MRRLEFAWRCQCCFKYRKSRMFWLPLKGISGKLKDRFLWRKICPQCWDKAMAGQIAMYGSTVLKNAVKENDDGN